MGSPSAGTSGRTIHSNGRCSWCAAALGRNKAHIGCRAERKAPVARTLGADFAATRKSTRYVSSAPKKTGESRSRYIHRGTLRRSEERRVGKEWRSGGGE